MKVIKNKKGFTLVELVVVIAVLAVLAAIAIPSVIGIINSANEAAAKTSAVDLDIACKDFYSGVVSGSINQSDHGAVSSSLLPTKSAAYSAKVSAARALTVNDAIKYAGISSTFPTDDSLKDFQYSNIDGTVTWAGTSGTPSTGNSQMKLSVTLGDMYQNT